MGKSTFFVEQTSGWQNGKYHYAQVWTPLDKPEEHLVKEALEIKALSQAQQTLLNHYRENSGLLSSKQVEGIIDRTLNRKVYDPG